MLINVSVSPQIFKIYSIEDTSSALYTHGKSMDEVPALFSEMSAGNADSLQIRQAKARDYKATRQLFSGTNDNKTLDFRENNNPTDFIFITVLVLPVLLSLWMIKSAFSRVQGAFRAIFNNRYASIFTRNFSISNHISTYIIIFNAALAETIALWLWLLQNKYIVDSERQEILFLLFLFFIGYYIYRYLLIFLSKVLFLTQESTEQYLYFDYYVKTIISTILPLLLFAIAFSPMAIVIWYVAIGILSLLGVYRVIMTFYTGILERRYGMFYFILYFCTVEIVPVAFALKLLTERISI